MKVTAILPDEMIKDVQKYTGGKNITDSLTRALEDWLYTRRLISLKEELDLEPLQFRKDYSADSVRKLSNRQ